MAYDVGQTYAFTYQGVEEKAPSASGVYTIYTAQQWVYVGESDNIRQSLFRHLNEPSACMDRFGPLSFSFERAPAAERVSRQQALVAELEPACNPAKV
jgi:hypothetical protein